MRIKFVHARKVSQHRKTAAEFDRLYNPSFLTFPGRARRRPTSAAQRRTDRRDFKRYQAELKAECQERANEFCDAPF